MGEGEITAGDPRDPDVRELLARHLAFTHAHSPPEDVHALDLSGLLDPAVAFFCFRRGGRLLAVGALKRLDPARAELKSIHTAEEVRRQGIGRAMVEHLVAVARQRGFRQLSLETGSMPAFTASRALYAEVGFRECGPFGGYHSSPHSTFMTLALGHPRPEAR